MYNIKFHKTNLIAVTLLISLQYSLKQDKAFNQNPSGNSMFTIWTDTRCEASQTPPLICFRTTL